MCISLRKIESYVERTKRNYISNIMVFLTSEKALPLKTSTMFCGVLESGCLQKPSENHEKTFSNSQL